MEEGFNYGPHHHAQDLRNRLLQQLSVNGATHDLMALREGRPEHDRLIIGLRLRNARARQADLALTPTPPAQLLELLRRADARLVRDDADLQRVIIRQLDRLQHDIAHNGAFREIWNGEQHQSEDDISDWIQRRFRDQITSGVIVDREVQVLRPKQQGIGTRIDLTATARTNSRDMACVLIEAKHLGNDELLDAMTDQLIERYLVPRGRSHGVYLVYWITPAQRPKDWSRRQFVQPIDLMTVLRKQADVAKKTGFHIEPYILDISRPT
jgi:hypothetical protein